MWPSKTMYYMPCFKHLLFAGFLTGSIWAFLGKSIQERKQSKPRRHWLHCDPRPGIQTTGVPWNSCTHRYTSCHFWWPNSLCQVTAGKKHLIAMGRGEGWGQKSVLLPAENRPGRGSRGTCSCWRQEKQRYDQARALFCLSRPAHWRGWVGHRIRTPVSLRAFLRNTSLY